MSELEVIDIVLPLLSALFGLVLINFTVLVKSHACRTGWIGGLPVEVRYIALFSFVLLIALNGNQWIPGYLLFPFLIIASIITVMISIRDLTESDRRAALRDGLSLLSLQVFTLFFVFIAFQVYRYWLLESSNHDSLIYYYGGYWANESRLFVGSEAVRAKWGFTTWIGFDRPLYRGGTFTLAAWVQYFSPRVSGSGLYFIAAYSATMAWFAVRLFPASIKGPGSRFVTAPLALVVALSTGLVGALVNSNLATVMGGSSLVLVFALALRSDIRPNVRYGLMAAWCAVCAHFYGESVFYAGMLVFFVFLFEFPRQVRALKPVGVIRLAVFLSLIVFGLGNIPVGQAVSSLFLFSEIDKTADWFSWYLHQPPVAWIGSFVGGLLMGHSISIPIVVVSSIITAFSAGCLIYFRQTRVGVLALIGTSLMAVIYVEMTSYQYGEHKILHLLGPSWTFAIVATVVHLMNGIKSSFSGKSLVFSRKMIVVSLSISLVVVVSSFLSASLSMLNHMRAFHSIDFGMNTLTSYIQPGETVLVDDNEWIGIERFFKTHYLAFQLQHQGAKVLMPSIASNSLRGGYQRDFINDTLKDARTVDWLVKSKGYAIKEEKIVSIYGNPVWENADYRLYRVGKNPVIVAGNGWHDCEPIHCWTTAPFEIETYISTADQFELVVDFSVFSPPEKGVISVRTSDGKLLASVSATQKQMHLKLPDGWSRLVFEPNWSISSPKDSGKGEDSRKLFVAIQRMEAKPLREEIE
jgi:hypothetical protein